MIPPPLTAASAPAGDGTVSPRGEALAPVSARLTTLLLLAAVVVGVVLRLAQYLADRSFWADEAALVLNIQTHTAAQLLGPLDYNQASPPLFLLMERGVFRLLGGSEYALRLLPLAFSVASVILFALLARRLLPSPWDAFATALFALADRFVWHGTEVKQYGTDLFVAVLLSWVAFGPPFRPLHVAEEPGAEKDRARRFLWVAALAALCVWFSYTAALVFAGISLSLIPRRPWRKVAVWLSYLLGNLAVGISFLLVLRVAVAVQRNSALVDYWQGEFLNLQRPQAWPWWLVRHLHSLCNYPIPAAGPAVLLGAVAGGYALFKARRFQTLGILSGPIAVAILAAALRRYPFDGARLTLFLCGSLLLLATIGFRWIHQIWGTTPPGGRPASTPAPGRPGEGERIEPKTELTQAWNRWLATATRLPPAYLLAVAIAWAGFHLAVPRTRGHLRPVMQYLTRHMRSGDGFYVLEPREFQVYWTGDDRNVRFFKIDRANEIPFQRFWIVWSFNSQHGHSRFDPLLKWAGRIATRRDTVTSSGGEAVLFERDSRIIPPDALSPPPPP